MKKISDTAQNHIMCKWPSAVQKPLVDLCGTGIFIIVYVLKKEFFFLCTDKNAGNFVQDSEGVKTSIGGTATVSLWRRF